MNVTEFFSSSADIEVLLPMAFSRVPLSTKLWRARQRFQHTLPQLKTRRETIRNAITEIEDIRGAKRRLFVDTYGRTHTYLRISLTEKCNLRCLYCMPEEGVTLSPASHLLTSDEIVRLVELFASHGVNKIRLTGGEPTIRKDLVEIVERIRNVPGIKEIGITSNGIILAKKLRQLQDAGLTKINISLDTLNERKFTMMTRRNGFTKVMKCIDLAENLFPMVKVNTVVMRNVNDDEVTDFVKLTTNRRLCIRFIEYMPFGGNDFSTKKFIDYKSLLADIEKTFPGSVRRLRDAPNDTTKHYKIEGSIGNFGFITSMSEHFCGTCNRLRITADGNLKVCLHGNAEVSLRDLLRGGASAEELSDVIQSAVESKKKQHAGMENLKHMPNRPMILIGG
ncbi:Molybdenum cofactor biosynthesis protein moc-5 [Parelaphostrongylus tenuis]|uniref:GTP 3',8-cyclase n=1 Tax=Parelaphostrongylus tenuis TaxID=148309 RepID=A0AAD5MH23_PARTN|nr:Molybdenum cofactor biosynthesis protein moc-5 [Parelaphostrongylus tenuis]